MKTYMFLIFLFLCFFMVIAPVVAQTDNVIVATYGSTPAIDGRISDNEWSDASAYSFNGTEVFVKQDGVNLYIAFKAPLYADSGFFIMFDVKNDKSSLLLSDDILIGITKNNTLIESDVYDSQWAVARSYGWRAHTETVSNSTHAEFKIEYIKLNITAGTEKTMGINFRYDVSNNPPMLDAYFIWSNVGTTEYPEFFPASWGTINSEGYNWIPEFPSLLALLLLILVASFIAVAWKKRSSHFE